MIPTVVPQFLSPTSRQFPFDHVVSEIVSALEGRNWTVPGLHAKFKVYGSGREYFRMLKQLSGPNFALVFGRTQRKISSGVYMDEAGLESIYLPSQKKLTVHPDESGPELWVYSGSNWNMTLQATLFDAKDPEQKRYAPRGPVFFYKGQHLESKMTGSTKTRPKNMVAITPGDKVFGQHGMQFHLSLDALFAECVIFLSQQLKFIQSHVAAGEGKSFSPELIAYPTDLPKFFTSVDADQPIHKIMSEGITSKELPRHQQYAIAPRSSLFPFETWVKGSRLQKGLEPMSWGVPQRKGFLMSRPISLQLVPKYANDIFVADLSVVDQVAQPELLKSVKLTLPSQIMQPNAVRLLETLTPVQNYRNTFQQPVLLIFRELDFDEVQLPTFRS